MGHDGVSESVVEFLEVYQEVDEDHGEVPAEEQSTYGERSSANAAVMLPHPALDVPAEEQATYGEGSSANELTVISVPHAVELQTTATNQGQGSNETGNKKATKINMKSLLKEKIELKRKLVESTIKFQQECIRIQEERNEILKDIGNKLKR